MKTPRTALIAWLSAIAGAGTLLLTPDAGAATPVGFDRERAIHAFDTDGDGFPDITEEIVGTDVLDSDDFPAAPVQVMSFPAASCRSGFQQAGDRLCISSTTQNAMVYTDAAVSCRDQMAHVCTYEDLAYVYLRSNLDATYDPQGRWIGNSIGDDQVFCGNRSITFDNDPDIYNFEGECSKTASLPYWCCHDDDEGFTTGSGSGSGSGSSSSSGGGDPLPCCGTCFAAGTPIAMADGTLRSIEDVAAGDQVLSYETATRRVVPSPVTETFIHPGSASLVVINGSLRATPNHLMYVRGRWVRADALRIGDELLALDEGPSPLSDVSTTAALEIRALVMIPADMTTYNLEVDDRHNYFAGGVLVHNKPACQICDPQ